MPPETVCIDRLQQDQLIGDKGRRGPDLLQSEAIGLPRSFTIEMASTTENAAHGAEW
jgi:hypothetical protein